MIKFIIFTAVQFLQISAAPLIARKRFQFNIPIHPVQYVGVTKKLKSTMMPIAWVEEVISINLHLSIKVIHLLFLLKESFSRVLNVSFPIEKCHPGKSIFQALC